MWSQTLNHVFRYREQSMRILRRLMMISIALLSVGANASFLDELAKLESHKLEGNAQSKVTQQTQQATPQKSNTRRYITLSTGKRIDITDWQIVHFMSSNCSYCKQFNPTLKQIADATEIPVFTYSFDGQGDESFPEVFPTNKEVISTFFAELPQATPTDFLINVNTMVTLPLTQGATTYNAFLQRLDEVFIYVDKNLGGVR